MLQPSYRPNSLAFLTVIVSSDRRHATVRVRAAQGRMEEPVTPSRRRWLLAR